MSSERKKSTSRGTKGVDRTPRRRTAAPASAAANSEYDVGYAKPPVRRQWKPGVSGNPKGRPTKSKNMKTIARETLNGTVVLNEGGRRRRISYLEAILRKQIESGLKGSEKAAFAVIKICAHLGLFEDAVDAPSVSFSALEEEWLEELLKRTGPKEGADNED